MNSVIVVFISSSLLLTDPNIHVFQLPDKSIASLVKYYYSWKKTRSRTSLMDRQARKLAVHREEGSEVGSELGSNTDSDSDEKVASFVTNFDIKSVIYFNIVCLIFEDLPSKLPSACYFNIVSYI
jgi:hypothetical protein